MAFGKSNVTCDASTGVWDPLPECRCIAPIPPLNTQVVQTNLSSIRYRCDLRFQLTGNETVSCDLATSKWSPLPKCTCLPPAHPPNSKPRLVTAEQYEYACNTGFELVGPTTIRCNLTTAQWSPLPQCRCAAPAPLPANARIADRKDAAIRYECDRGFQLIGKDIVACNPTTGKWDPLPKCVSSSAQPVELLVAAATTTTTTTAPARRQTAPPATPVVIGPQQVTAGDCPFPGLPANGRATSRMTGSLAWESPRSFAQGEVVVFSCDPTWRMPATQQSRITCQSGGTWSGAVPRCGLYIFFMRSLPTVDC